MHQFGIKEFTIQHSMDELYIDSDFLWRRHFKEMMGALIISI